MKRIGAIASDLVAIAAEYEEKVDNALIVNDRERSFIRMLIEAEIQEMRANESSGHSHQDGIDFAEDLLRRIN